MHSVLSVLSEDHYNDVLMEGDLKPLEEIAKVTRRPDLWKGSEDGLIDALRDTDADILLTSWQAPMVTVKVHKAHPKLAFICHTAGELKHYVEREVLADGMVVTNWGIATSHSTAEGAMAMTLACLRNYHNMPYWMRRDGLYWETPPPEDEGLFGQRVGLHGLGAIAQEYVKLIAPFSCRVSAFSPHCPDSVFEELGVARADSLEGLYGSNRIISCHAASRPDTCRLVNAKLLGLIEDGGLFINTGRGAVVDEDALVAELKKGRIRAALDVYEEEPLPAEHTLRFLDNCMVVPHRAGPTPDRRRDMGKHAVDNIIRYINGDELDGVVTLKKYDLMT